MFFKAIGGYSNYFLPQRQKDTEKNIMNNSVSLRRLCAVVGAVVNMFFAVGILPRKLASAIEIMF
jgi:hypothetical protein